MKCIVTMTQLNTKEKWEVVVEAKDSSSALAKVLRRKLWSYRLLHGEPWTFYVEEVEPCA